MMAIKSIKFQLLNGNCNALGHTLEGRAILLIILYAPAQPKASVENGDFPAKI